MAAALDEGAALDGGAADRATEAACEAEEVAGAPLPGAAPPSCLQPTSEPTMAKRRDAETDRTAAR